MHPQPTDSDNREDARNPPSPSPTADASNVSNQMQSVQTSTKVINTKGTQSRLSLKMKGHCTSSRIQTNQIMTLFAILRPLKMGHKYTKMARSHIAIHPEHRVTVQSPLCGSKRIQQQIPWQWIWEPQTRRQSASKYKTKYKYSPFGALSLAPWPSPVESKKCPEN